MTAHDDELGGLRLLDQLVSRRITDNDGTHPYVGIALLPRRQTLDQNLLADQLHRGPLDTGEIRHVDIAERVYGDEFHLSARSFVEGDRRRRFRCR